MHYDGYSFSKAPILDHPTILDRKTLDPVIAQRVRPSIGDIQRICRLYSCENCGQNQIACGNGQGNFSNFFFAKTEESEVWLSLNPSIPDILICGGSRWRISASEKRLRETERS